MENNWPESLTNYGNNQVTPSEDDWMMLDLEELLSIDGEPDEAATTRMKEEAARKKKEAARAKDAARKRRERRRNKANQQSLLQELGNSKITVKSLKEELLILKNTRNNLKEDYDKLQDDYDKLKEDYDKQSDLTYAAGMGLVKQNLHNVAAFGAIPNAIAGDVVSELMQKVKNLEEEMKCKDDVVSELTQKVKNLEEEMKCKDLLIDLLRQ